MSTDHQKYSTQNQAAAIAEYASSHGLTIVRTYQDAGRSGLHLKGRAGLEALIGDVQNGRARFDTILVYDVSRWGRFQDTDEAAHYEYVCKKAGLTVQYCAEEFVNDGTVGSTILKNLKRAMAGEFSRELSAKVFAGHCRLASLGYRQGGRPGYGLRRLLIDEHGNAKDELKSGQHKYLQTDRVVLVPGPPNEVDTVRRIFRLLVEKRRSIVEIAGILNADELVNEKGRPWHKRNVAEVLTNEKYIGNNVYARSSFKLKMKRRRNPPKAWVRSDGVFEAIVDRSIFMAANQIIRQSKHSLTDAQMLDCLTNLLSKKGVLSSTIIDAAENVPCSCAYRERFGGMMQAYEKIGYELGLDRSYLETHRFLATMLTELVADTIANIRQIGGAVRIVKSPNLLEINGEFTAAIVMVRCHPTLRGRSVRWTIRLGACPLPDMLIAVRMNEANRQIRDFYVMPRIAVNARNLKICGDNSTELDAFRHDSLDPLIELCARRAIRQIECQ